MLSKSNEVRLLPRFHDEDQSANTAISERNLPVKKLEMKFFERSYDRSGKRCHPMINSNIGKRDLQYTYAVVGNTVESYIHYRKLDRCQALFNFNEYRNKIYKREKIGPYAVAESKPVPKVFEIIKEDTPPPSVTPSTQSHIGPSITITSSESVTSEQSARVFPPTPIPSLQSVNSKKSENLSPVPSKSPIKSLKSKTSGQLSPSSRKNTPKPSQKTFSPSTTQPALTPPRSPHPLKHSSSKKLSPIPSKKKTSSHIQRKPSSTTKGH